MDGKGTFTAHDRPAKGTPRGKSTGHGEHAQVPRYGKQRKRGKGRRR